MIIQENQLRPPSPKEMAARYVPLERLRVSWTYDCWDDTHCRHDGNHNETTPLTTGLVDSMDAGFTTLELIEFHKDYAIPYEAFVVNDGYDGDRALDWKHLRMCEGCNQWFLPDTDHTTTDPIHLAKMREMAKLLTGEDPA